MLLFPFPAWQWHSCGSYVHLTKAKISWRMLQMSDQNSNYSYKYSSGVTEILSGFGWHIHGSFPALCLSFSSLLSQAWKSLFWPKIHLWTLYQFEGRKQNVEFFHTCFQILGEIHGLLLCTCPVIKGWINCITTAFLPDWTFPGSVLISQPLVP